MNPGHWKVERVVCDGSPMRMPYLITIQSDAGQVMCLRSPRPWPGAQCNCYVQRQRGDIIDPLEPVESCRILDVYKVAGSQAQTLYVLLDRAQRKRASFLFVRKDGKEIGYFRTPDGIQAHRSRSYLQPASLRVADEVVIDTRERYPWPLSAERVTRAALPAGDYALRVKERFVAVIERKSFANALQCLGSLESYHGHLSELAQFPDAALVIEGRYSDFADPGKTSPMAAPRCLRALADIDARHPNLKVVFADTRKLAGLWAACFFGAIAARIRSGNASLPEQGQLPIRLPRTHLGGSQARVRELVLTQLGSSFSTLDLARVLADVSERQIVAALQALCREGRLSKQGRGRRAMWQRLPD